MNSPTVNSATRKLAQELANKEKTEVFICYYENSVRFFTADTRPTGGFDMKGLGLLERVQPE